MKKAGVDRVKHSGHTPWLPNPYSRETGKRLSKMRGIPNKYKAMIVKPLPEKKYYKGHLVYVRVWKDLFFIPEIPRIKDGWLIGPATKNRPPSRYRRVLSSLNRFPEKWKDYECVLRQIEPQWFVRMCNGH
jgi:hypothetical protein